MELSIKNYQRQFKDITLKRGREYIRENRIKELERSEDGKVLAKVQGSKLYKVSLNLSDSGEITDPHCNCPYDGVGMCKHLAAVLLTLEKRFDKQYSSLSSEGISFLIRKYQQKAELNERTDASNDEKVHIQPLLSIKYNGVLMYELRIGRTRMYMVTDILDLYRRFQYEDHKRYGKELEFVHTYNAIDEKSRKLLDMTFLNVATSGGYRYNSRREFQLDKSNADRFFELYRDDTLTLDGRQYQVRFEDPSVVIEIKKMKNGRFLLRLSHSLQFLCSGLRSYYLIESSHTISAASEEFTAAASVLLEMLCRRKDVYISKKEMTGFYAAVLKPVSAYVQLKGAELLEEFIPPELTPQLYVDCGEGNEIFARLIFLYGESDFAEGKDSPYRDPIAERRAEAAVLKYFSKDDQNEIHPLIITDDGAAYEFLTAGIEELAKTMELYISDRFGRMAVRPSVKPAVGVRPQGNLLELEITDENYSPEELLELLTAYRRGAKYHRLKDGSFAIMDTALSELVLLTNALDISDKELLKDKLHIPQYRMLYLDSLKAGSDIRLKRSPEFKAAVRRFRELVEDSEQFPVPAELDTVMRDYQKHGFRWLKTIAGYGFGGILADDMGLGKTIQAISLIQDLKQCEETHLPCLVVCPSSLTLNWESELKRFAPSLRTVTVIGTAAQRSSLMEEIPETDVVITSYSLLTRDIAKYEPFSFRLHFIDEAQYIKNHNTQTARAVKGIRSQLRFALTGTPVENSLAELWSIFDFIMPGYLFGYSRFKNNFETPIVSGKDEQAVRALQKTVSPFILRRLKADVLKELPEKTETVLTSRMEGEQSKVYSANVVTVKQSLGQGFEGQEERIKLLAMLTRLRQLCCDPHLVYENFKGKSAKLEQCMELIDSCVNAGHKILLFSQFTSMLDIIAKRLKENTISYYILTGHTKAAERLKTVNAFNEDDTKVFLISLKAGGTGLNLTGADIVIHYDPWWNLSAENQASDRAHRIGQHRNVQIYKLIAEKSIEENILKLQQSKAALSDMAVGGEGDIMRMSADELLSLLE